MKNTCTYNVFILVSPGGDVCAFNQDTTGEVTMYRHQLRPKTPYPNHPDKLKFECVEGHARTGDLCQLKKGDIAVVKMVVDERNQSKAHQNIEIANKAMTKEYQLK